MICKHCGLAIHKCSSADEYHPDDRAEYMKELNGSGCIHEPAIRPTPRAVDGGQTEVKIGQVALPTATNASRWAVSPRSKTWKKNIYVMELIGKMK